MKPAVKSIASLRFFILLIAILKVIKAVEIIDNANNETVFSEPPQNSDEAADFADVPEDNMPFTDDEVNQQENDGMIQGQIRRSIVANNNSLDDEIDLDGMQMGDGIIGMQVIEGPDGEIIVGPGGPMIMMDDGDDDDDHVGGIPPEILELMQMTEMMHRRAMTQAFKKPEPQLPRNDESHEDIMKRMNRLSVEIGEKHDRNKVHGHGKSQRTSKVIMVVSILLAVVLVSVGINQLIQDDKQVDGNRVKKNLKVVKDAKDHSIKVTEHKRND